jgi:hypothetical protein
LRQHRKKSWRNVAQDKLTSRVPLHPNPKYSPCPQPLTKSARWSRRDPQAPVSRRNKSVAGEVNQDPTDSGLTRSGSHNPSATPYNLSVAVPATTKSLGVVIHPILERKHPSLFSLVSSTPLQNTRAHVSMLQINGLGLGSIAEAAGIPAITGSMK